MDSSRKVCDGWRRITGLSGRGCTTNAKWLHTLRWCWEWKIQTSLAYYYVRNGGELGTDEYVPMDDTTIKDLYIITTARKRDTFEWEEELSPFLLSTDKEENLYTNKVVIDSWNNIKKYADIKDASLYLTSSVL